MKASLRFREEQNPLFKAKIPLNFLGLPFQSSLSAGNSKELSLGLGVVFDSGPSFRLSYRPNDAFNPFSLLVKTGFEHFGIDAPITMTAEFNFASLTSNPRIFLSFNPHFGDFSIKKSQCSPLLSPFNLLKRNDVVFKTDDKSIEMIDSDNGDYGNDGCKTTKLPLKSKVESAVNGMELGAKSVFQIRNGVVLKLQWGVKISEGIQALVKNPTAKMSQHGIPIVLNKIMIEQVKNEDKKVGQYGSGVSNVALTEMCLALKRQLEMLRYDNARLEKVLSDLKGGVWIGNKGIKVIEGVERKSDEIKEGDMMALVKFGE
ncbi:uncharacterized protein LOC110691377 [Chenopodium quinoa]|uniref:uncharacterized protein LOC110691377 n=1 Tax=Chenopodium quinoa TaxID=63459 RepID=UPI000B76D8D5|nr:uncharacterized protein LOC110691377 [Chenopodium quinoa]